MKKRKASSVLGQSRPGFSLPDFTILSAAFAIIITFGIRGMFEARKTAVQTQSFNKCRELGTASQAYAAKRRGLLPASGIWSVGDDAIKPMCSDMRTEWQTLDKPNIAHMRYSWCYELLPHLDAVPVYNAWNKDVGYNDEKKPGQPDGKTNAELANVEIPSFTNPGDDSAQKGQGNLSYVCNGGFCTVNGFHPLTAASSAVADEEIENLKKMGMMFLDSTKRSYSSQNTVMIGKLSTTILFVENSNAGVGKHKGNWKGNWACPHPYNTSFFVNGKSVGIPKGPYDYSKANQQGTDAPPNGKGKGGGINSAKGGTLEQVYPYPCGPFGDIVNVAHANGQPGSISEDIDAAVWARLVCPLGSKLINPKTGKEELEKEDGTGGYTQRPLNEEDIR